MKIKTGKIGFCIGEDIKRTDKQTLELLKGFGTPAIADGLNKFNCMDAEIKPACAKTRIAGNAITVRMRPGDNLMLHKAIGIASENDIIVVDTCGCKNYSVMGDLMASAAFKKGIGGIVIDGGIRDFLEIQDKKFPIFSKFIVNSVGDKDGPGEINLPISCAGVPVLPGDIIVGDINGIVVINPDFVDQIIEGTIKKLEYEKKREQEIANGIITKPDIDAKLTALGVI